jgi:phosphatidate cytidylyltransferase
MEFNGAVFRTRTITAVIFVAIMLAGLLIDKWSFLILFTVIHFGCWVEYQKLVGLIYPDYALINPLHKYAIMLAGWGFMLIMTSGAYDTAYLNLERSGKRLLYIMPLVVILSEIFFSGGKVNFKRLWISLLGLVYISLSLGLMIRIRSKGVVYETDFGYILVIIFIASIWINDTMAYLVGSFIGKRPLSKVSPKKTWEGTIGGAVLAIITVTLLGKLLLDADYLLVMFLSLIAVVTGTVGDLFESWLKRKANVKDSGNLMPGHGGFLDRFDSLLIATPFVWLYVEFLL